MIHLKKGTNGRFGYVNKKGQWVLDPIYPFASRFYEGKAAIVLNEENSKYEIINERGENICNSCYDKIEVIDKRYFIVMADKLYGIVDIEGNILVEVDNDWVFKPKNGMVTCMKDDYYGIVNLSEPFPLKANCIYDKMIEFYDAEEYAIASKNKKCGVIDKYENTIVPFEYEEITIYKNVFFVRNFDMNWGAIDVTGEVIIPFKYEKLYFSGDKIAAIRKETDEYPIA